MIVQFNVLNNLKTNVDFSNSFTGLDFAFACDLTQISGSSHPANAWPVEADRNVIIIVQILLQSKFNFTNFFILGAMNNIYFITYRQTVCYTENSPENYT